MATTPQTGVASEGDYVSPTSSGQIPDDGLVPQNSGIETVQITECDIDEGSDQRGQNAQERERQGREEVEPESSPSSLSPGVPYIEWYCLSLPSLLREHI